MLGSYENAIDFVAVQRATIARNIISDADDWCAYVKGGSTDIEVRSNEIRDCGTGGFTAGQGTGLELMVAPSLTHEATNVVFAGNYIHDTWGAAFGVNGGHNVTMEGNVAAPVGTRSHLLEVSFGSRSCDGDAVRCATLLGQGAWGTSVTGGDVAANIPDLDVTIRGNTIVNPSGVRARWQHLEISPPRTNTGRAAGPSPARTDDGLRITGNVIRHGGSDMPPGPGATASPTRGGAARTCTATTERFCSITGLTNGTAYVVTIVGVNAVGSGLAARVPGYVVPRGRCVVTPPAPPNPGFAAAITAQLAIDPIFVDEFGAEIARQARCNVALGDALRAAVADAIRREPGGAVATAFRSRRTRRRRSPMRSTAIRAARWPAAWRRKGPSPETLLSRASLNARDRTTCRSARP